MQRLVRRLRRLRYAVVNYIRHPRPITCLDCGFLAWDQDEVDTSLRILMSAPSMSGQPVHPEEHLNCFRSMWTWQLHYVRLDAGTVYEELDQSRRGCDGFYRYKAGWSPPEHRDLLLKSSENRFRVWLAIISGSVGVIVGFVLARLIK